MTDLRKLTIASFTAQLAAGKFSLPAFYRELSSYIKETDRELKAFESFDSRILEARAAEVDAEIQKRGVFGKLCGVPIAVKDVINTVAYPTGRGSAYWKGYQAGNNARIISEMEQEGGIVTGKTVTAELAVHHPGETRNPHNHDYSPGTSSMGSAVAVSAGMSLAALGTQTGSSIIRPASYTGIFGFKPSYGVIPRTGVLKTTDTLDHVGFFANHIEDISLLFHTLRVKGANYPISDAMLAERASCPPVMRIGVLRPQYLWKNYQGYVKDAFEALIAELSADPSLRVSSVQDDGWFNDSHRIHTTLYDKNLSYYFKKESKDRKVISSTLASMVDHGNAISIPEFHAAAAEQERMQTEFDGLFDGYDLLLTPSTANIAPLRKEYKEVDDTGLIWSLLGTPSLNIPVFTGPHNMPFGLQATGVKYSDARILSAVDRLCQKRLLRPRSGAPLAETAGVR